MMVGVWLAPVILKKPGEYFASFHEGYILIALESYFDGSNTGDWRKGSFVTLAGIAADDSLRSEFDKEC